MSADGTLDYPIGQTSACAGQRSEESRPAVHRRFIILPHNLPRSGAADGSSPPRVMSGKHEDRTVTTKTNPVDHRPFRSKAEHLREKQLEAQYRGLAIPELVAALASRNERAENARTTKLLPAG